MYCADKGDSFYSPSRREFTLWTIYGSILQARKFEKSVQTEKLISCYAVLVASTHKMNKFFSLFSVSPSICH